MKTRRHSNNKGERQIKTGKPPTQVKRMAKKMTVINDIIEIEEGYPTTACLRKIKKLNRDEAREFVLSLLDTEDLSYARIWKEINDDDEILVNFATCGWSGNEDIIGAMLENIHIRLFMYYAWKTGGLHTFRIGK